MELTAQNVGIVVKDCLPEDGAINEEKAKAIMAGEPSDDFVLVQGVVSTVAFDKHKIEERKEDIRSMLSQLPETFRKEVGGGWTFLNACNRQDGVQWGEHRDMEFLFCLGIAAGMAAWTLPKEMWSVLPGGMPYVAIEIPNSATNPLKDAPAPESIEKKEGISLHEFWCPNCEEANEFRIEIEIAPCKDYKVRRLQCTGCGFVLDVDTIGAIRGVGGGEVGLRKEKGEKDE